jgi:hypothetical protein
MARESSFNSCHLNRAQTRPGPQWYSCLQAQARADDRHIQYHSAFLLTVTNSRNSSYHVIGTESLSVCGLKFQISYIKSVILPSVLFACGTWPYALREQIEDIQVLLG